MEVLDLSETPVYQSGGIEPWPSDQHHELFGPLWEEGEGEGEGEGGGGGGRVLVLTLCNAQYCN